MYGTPSFLFSDKKVIDLPICFCYKEKDVKKSIHTGGRGSIWGEGGGGNKKTHTVMNEKVKIMILLNFLFTKKRPLSVETTVRPA